MLIVIPDGSDYIYALVAIHPDGTEEVFYIGRTIHPDRREYQHRDKALKRQGTDDRDYRIRELEAQNIPWSTVWLDKCSPSFKFYEKYYVHQARLAGAPLTNMKQGDDKIFERVHANNPIDFANVYQKLLIETERVIPDQTCTVRELLRSILHHPVTEEAENNTDELQLLFNEIYANLPEMDQHYKRALDKLLKDPRLSSIKIPA